MYSKAIIAMSGCFLLLCGVVTAGPCVLCPQPHSTPVAPPVLGSLILHYADNSTNKIDYDSSSEDCYLNHLPNKKIAKVEVNSAHFVLYSRRNWRGKMADVRSVGSREYSTEEIPGITRVKSLRQQGCRTRNKT